MSELLLKASTGRNEGTRSSRRLRRSGQIPAVVYGLGSDPLPVAVEWMGLRSAITTELGLNALITLDIDGKKQLSLVKDIQRHPVRRDVLHVDFIRVEEGAEVEVEVPLILTGEAKLVERANGMVDQVIHNLPVLAKPDSIPEVLYADVSLLEVGNSLRVSEIEMPDGVHPAGDPDAAFAVGLITRSTKEFLRSERAAEAAADGEGEGAQAEATEES